MVLISGRDGHGPMTDPSPPSESRGKGSTLTRARPTTGKVDLNLLVLSRE